MANVYWKYDGNNVIFSNYKMAESNLWSTGSPVAEYHNVKFQLMNGKFVFPRYAGCLFYGATNTTYDMRGWDCSECTEIGQLFYKNENLTSLDLSELTFGQITRADYTFARCWNLRELNIYPISDMSHCSIANNMFEGCSSLRTVSAAPDTDWDNGTTDCTNTFSGCYYITNWDGSTDQTHANNTTPNGYFNEYRKKEKYNVYEKDSEGWWPVKVWINYYGGWDQTEVYM